MSKKFIIVLILVIFAGGTYLYLSRLGNDNLKAPGNDWQSAKKVEDYFIERLNMSPEEASSIRNRQGANGMVNLRINTDTTLQGLIGNLYHYGFIRNEKAFLYALENTKDTTPSNKSIKVGTNGTIDQNAEYRISENMSAWDLAATLLNKPTGHFPYDEYNYFFMP